MLAEIAFDRPDVIDLEQCAGPDANAQAEN